MEEKKRKKEDKKKKDATQKVRKKVWSFHWGLCLISAGLHYYFYDWQCKTHYIQNPARIVQMGVIESQNYSADIAQLGYADQVAQQC